ncbi:MAG: NAD-glutamate dehydrogenase [Victivallales bacterium]|nr:NAD-glutamate dehydrogenase [Victivallales bacterium]
MKTTNSILDEIVSRHTEKLQYWYDTLHEVMPDYFFKTFSTKHIENIISLLFNLDNEKGIQRIEHDDSITLIYLKSYENNLLATSRIMRHHIISSAVAYKSKQKIIIDNIPRTLIIEHFTLAAQERGSLLFSYQEIITAYKKKYKTDYAALKELYERINWTSVADLNIERLVDRLKLVMDTQDKDYINASLEKFGKDEIKLTLAHTCNSMKGGFYHKIIEVVSRAGFNIERAYLRDLTYQNNPNDFKHMPVMVNTIYLSKEKWSVNSARVFKLLKDIKVLNWSNILDVFHSELVYKHDFTISETNVLRAAAEFVHTQLALIDKNAYSIWNIYRFMATYPNILSDLLTLFKIKFDPKSSYSTPKSEKLIRKAERKIDAINSGIHEKDILVKHVFFSVSDFFQNILKTNFYVENKSALAFRMSCKFMEHYERLSTCYTNALPKDRPFGIFYFYRNNAIGFHVRFAEIARGGWRTVIPQDNSNELEQGDIYNFTKDEIFREVFILAHTQHLKNKDIYQGGAKMITLLNLSDDKEKEAVMLEAQRSICTALVSLINYDKSGRLKDENIIDYLGLKEIIEIGPDENMFDPMIEWIGDYAENAGYTLGAGLISGKRNRGINHKEFGVTSFGVHQYFLRTLQMLNIDPTVDECSVKISGGPYGDVAGNELKLLLHKENDHYIYPKLKIVAITDGPAAVYDPYGIDRERLTEITLKQNLDAFPPESLKGEGAYMVFNRMTEAKGVEQYRFVFRKNSTLHEKMIGRDEFMQLFHGNIFNYADVFIPCGGRPSTIDCSNWMNYISNGKPSSLAIIEGANSFITPTARIKLQDEGVIIIKDASANKCGVITSSYEILAGLMLSPNEFTSDKNALVNDIMDKLKKHAVREAEWLFSQFKLSRRKMTELTESLSRQINAKNAEISFYLNEHPEIDLDKLILEHLPSLFTIKYHDRIKLLSMEYQKAIASVELATRIIYSQSGSLEQEIKSVI